MAYSAALFPILAFSSGGPKHIEVQYVPCLDLSSQLIIFFTSLLAAAMMLEGRLRDTDGWRVHLQGVFVNSSSWLLHIRRLPTSCRW